MPRQLSDGPWRCPGVTRRSFLADTGMGFTGLALGAMLARGGVARLPAAETARRPRRLAPKAKAVIWIFMCGGVSHVESFDPKPALNRYAGKTIDEYALQGRPQPGEAERHRLGQPGARRPQGPDGSEHRLQEIRPERAGGRRLVAATSARVPTTSRWSARSGRPTTTTAPSSSSTPAGTCCEGAHPDHRLVGRTTGWARSTTTCRSSSCWASRPATAAAARGRHGAAYLGPEHDGVQLNLDAKDPLPFVAPGLGHEPRGAGGRVRACWAGSTAWRASTIPTTRRCGPGSSRTSWPSACRRRCPRRCKLDEETAGDAGSSTAWIATRRVRSASCAWRPAGWSSAACGSCRSSTAAAAAAPGTPTPASRPTTASCRPRSTCRSPACSRTSSSAACSTRRSSSGAPSSAARRAPRADGRDHHPYGFCAWLAGGGIKGGVVHGATDEIGFHAVENRHYVTDIHATVLHQLGLDPRKLEVPGRKRLEIDFGQPIREIIA